MEGPLAGWPFQIFAQMMNDFDFYGSGFDVMSSPVASPKLPLDLGAMSLEAQFDLVQVPFSFDDDLVCSQPFADVEEPPVPKFEIQMTRKSAPVTPKRHESKHKLNVFKPFASFDAVEMTVKRLRDAMSVPRAHTKACPFPAILC